MEGLAWGMGVLFTFLSGELPRNIQGPQRALYSKSQVSSPLSPAERVNPGLRLDLLSSQRPRLFLLLDLITTNAELPTTSWFEQEVGHRFNEKFTRSPPQRKGPIWGLGAT